MDKPRLGVKTWELVVSDGGSTDGTGELVERYRGPCVGMTTEKAHGELSVVRLFRFERVPPFNSARIFALIAQLEPSVRTQASWIPEVIRAAAPDLLRDPMNPPDSHFGFVRGTLLNYPAYGRRLRNLLRGLDGRSQPVRTGGD